jgi:hypothetical protein
VSDMTVAEMIVSNGMPEDGGVVHGQKHWIEQMKGIKEKSDVAVNHPSHYCSHPSGIECIEITRHHDFCTGNAIKYLWRCGLKGGSEKRVEDLKKARKYIEFAIEKEVEG